jgi:pimeloyl-ACP methyl ester carboxylesterase
VLVSLFWGLQFVVIKIGLAAFLPLFFVALRFAAVAAILLPFVGRPTRRELGPMIVISAFFGGLNFALFFAGLGQGLASVLAVANQLSDKKTIARCPRDFVKALGLSRVALVGHDLGGHVAYAYAAQWPQEVSHLVFIESSLPSFGQEEAMDVSRGGSWHFGFNMAGDISEDLVRGREYLFVDHWLPEERPVETADAMLKFLAG